MPTSCIEPPSRCPSTRPSLRARWSAWRSRFAKAFRAWLRSTTGLYVSLAFAVLAAAQETPRQERIRFLDGKVEVAEVVSKDGEGVTLRLAGLTQPVRFAWWQLDPADAERLRGEGTGDPIPASGDFTVAGVRVRTIDGRIAEGVLQPGAPPAELWVRNADGRHVIPAASVATQETIRLSLGRVYSPDEVVAILVGRIRPSSAEDYDRLGAELQRQKLEERARSAFRMAEVLRHPDWPETRITTELVKLRDRIEDLAVKRSIFQVQESALEGDYDAALKHLDTAEASAARSEDVVGELRRLRAQLQGLRGRARDERIVQEAWRSLEALLKARAMDRAMSWSEAKGFADDRLLAEALADVRRRLNFTPEDPAVKDAWDRRPAEATYKHAVDDGSWVSLNPEIRPPEEWWSKADDNARYRALKAYLVEKHLQVVRAERKSCGACGGTGIESGGAVCPACQGLKAQRVIIYR